MLATLSVEYNSTMLKSKIDSRVDIMSIQRLRTLTVPTSCLSAQFAPRWVPQHVSRGLERGDSLGRASAQEEALVMGQLRHLAALLSRVGAVTRVGGLARYTRLHGFPIARWESEVFSWPDSPMANPGVNPAARERLGDLPADRLPCRLQRQRV